jgi:N-6 DNA Methylase
MVRDTIISPVLGSYTPDYIARFIVEQTLGTHCREIFDGLLVDYAQKGASRLDDEIKWKAGKAEVNFWQAYRDRISKLRIVDSACGSGVFLVMAFEWLKAELTRANTRLFDLGEARLGDPDSEILTHNLFGVDVNEESVEIAKLSLWIKTARHGKVLDSLDENFRVGDNLIEDRNLSYRKHGFDWKERFKEIFDEGGFDIVVDNPPCVAMGLFKDLKKWLARFEVASDRADLYAYFFERGLKLLKPGGRLARWPNLKPAASADAARYDDAGSHRGAPHLGLSHDPPLACPYDRAGWRHCAGWEARVPPHPALRRPLQLRAQDQHCARPPVTQRRATTRRC